MPTNLSSLKPVKTFSELLDILHKKDPQPNPLYYHHLLNNANIILLEIAIRNQHLVAKDLNITLPKLSVIVPMLKEFHTANQQRDS